MSTPANAPYKLAQQKARDSKRRRVYVWMHDGYPRVPANRKTMDERRKARLIAAGDSL